MLAEGAGVPIGLDHAGANLNDHLLLKGTLDLNPHRATPAGAQGAAGHLSG